MTESNKDGGPAVGTGAAPTAPDSGAPGVSGGSVDASQLQATLDTLTQQVQSLAKTVSTIQSGKDRGVRKVEKEVSEIRQMLSDYEKLKERLGEDGASEQIEIKRQLAEIQASLNSLPAQPAGNGAGRAVDVAKVVADVGLDPQDPEVVAELTSKVWTDHKDAELAAMKLALRKANKPVPTPAQKPSAPSEPGVPSDAQAEYESKRKEIIENTRPGDERIRALTALKAEYAGKGLPIY